MTQLLRVILLIALFFASTFIVVKVTGVLSIEKIEVWLNQAQEISPLYLGGIVVILLFADLFIAVPTLTVIILSGYFLGYAYGALASFTGTFLAAVCGYTLSRYYGDTILRFLQKDKNKRMEVIESFQKHGVIMILLSRALPILPEVSACLSGMTRMYFPKFFLAWLCSALPYIVIASYSGSVSSLENPKPAIIACIGLSSVLWVSWYIYNRYVFKNKYNASLEE